MLGDIQFDAVQRLGLAFTPPKREVGLYCYYDTDNYQMAVEANHLTCLRTIPPDAHQWPPCRTVLGHETDRSQ